MAVAHGEAGDASPYLDDLAAHLVAHNHRRVDHVFALEDVDVGPADAGVVDLDHHLIRTRRGLGDLQQLDVSRLEPRYIVTSA